MTELSRMPFRRTKALRVQVDDFLDKVSEAAMAFEQGVKHYLKHGADDHVHKKLDQITLLERQGDDLRRHIETTLFTEMLIPDARGDVLSLLDDLDRLLDLLKERFMGLVFERPEFPDEMTEDLRELVTVVGKCLESMVLASRSYFRDPHRVRDHIHKIGFYESEADAVTIRLRKWIFDSSLPLDRKMYLRGNLLDLDDLANEAEDVGDRLAIYSVKRSL